MLRYDQVVQVLRAFRATYQDIYSPPTTTGLWMVGGTQAPFLLIEIDPAHATVDEFRIKHGLKPIFTVAHIPPIPVVVLPGSAAEFIRPRPGGGALAPHGVQPVEGEALAGEWANEGTIGWNFKHGADRYFLSCWHVLANANNGAAFGWPGGILINLSLATWAWGTLTFNYPHAVARLYDRIPVDPLPKHNHFDLAVGRYDPKVIVGAYRKCRDTDAGSKTYPSVFAAPTSGLTYYKVGTQTPDPTNPSHCSTGSWLAAGHTEITDHLDPADPLKSYSFVCQLMFTHMTEPGDSGSITAVQAPAGSYAQAVGLNFAVRKPSLVATEAAIAMTRQQHPQASQDLISSIIKVLFERATIANPLHALPWTFASALGGPHPGETGYLPLVPSMSLTVPEGMDC